MVSMTVAVPMSTQARSPSTPTGIRTPRCSLGEVSGIRDSEAEGQPWRDVYGRNDSGIGTLSVQCFRTRFLGCELQYATYHPRPQQ